MSRAAAMLVIVVVGGVQARAASLRSHVAIPGASVRLSDLFTDLQPGQDCDIGPSPAPGKRIVIPPTQLAAIASEFGVDWQAGTNYQALTLERSARLVARTEILALLRPALLGAGAAPTADVSLAAFTSPALPVDAAAVPEIQSLDFDPQSGRFSANLIFAVPDAEPTTLRVVGRAEQQVDILALAHPLPAGAVLAAGDLRTVRVRANGLRGGFVTTIQDVVGLALRRPLGDGVPLLQEMLIRPMLIDRGRPVILKLQSGGILLTAAGTALEAGASGDRIHVINSLSHAILVGQIMDGADIQVDPASTPMTLQATTLQGGLPQFSSSTSAGGRGWSSYAQEAQTR